MAQNLEALRQAAVIYPTIAILFTLPYLAWSYRRYGSVFSLRILIVYSFILYMLCVYCLVILPLPHGDAADNLHGHPMQLIPLDFVRDYDPAGGFFLAQSRKLAGAVYARSLSIGAAEPADDRAVWHLHAVLF